MTKYAYRLSAVLRPPLFEDGVVRGGDSVGPNFHRLCAPSCLGLRRRAGCPCAPPGEWPWPRQYMCGGEARVLHSKFWLSRCKTLIVQCDLLL
jgi:hypothetical protein